MPYYKYKKELMELLAKIKNPKLMENFLSDLLTPDEMNEVIVRLQIAKRLIDGKLTQRQIAKELKVALATITRGSKELLDPNSGFVKVMELIKKKKL